MVGGEDTLTWIRWRVSRSLPSENNFKKTRLVRKLVGTFVISGEKIQIKLIRVQWWLNFAFRGNNYYNCLHIEIYVRIHLILLTQVVKGMREYDYVPELGYRFDYIFLWYLVTEEATGRWVLIFRFISFRFLILYADYPYWGVRKVSLYFVKAAF